MTSIGDKVQIIKDKFGKNYAKRSRDVSSGQVVQLSMGSNGKYFASRSANLSVGDNVILSMNSLGKYVCHKSGLDSYPPESAEYRAWGGGDDCIYIMYYYSGNYIVEKRSPVDLELMTWYTTSYAYGMTPGGYHGGDGGDIDTLIHTNSGYTGIGWGPNWIYCDPSVGTWSSISLGYIQLYEYPWPSASGGIVNLLRNRWYGWYGDVGDIYKYDATTGTLLNTFRMPVELYDTTPDYADTAYMLKQPQGSALDEIFWLSGSSGAYKLNKYKVGNSVIQGDLPDGTAYQNSPELVVGEEYAWTDVRMAYCGSDIMTSGHRWDTTTLEEIT